jgi:PAS domain S-box-containing protein
MGDDAEKSARDEARSAGSSDAHLRHVVEQMPAIMWSTDRDLRFTSSTGAALASLGLAPGQAVGVMLSEFFQPGDAELAHHRRALNGESVAFESAYGGRTWACHVEPLRDGSGEIAGTIGLALDVTERKKAEQRIAGLEANARERVRWLSSILSSIGCAVIATEASQKIRLMNATAEQLTGWKEDDALGKPIRGVLRMIEPRTRLPLADYGSGATNISISGVPGEAILIARDGAERRVAQVGTRASNVTPIGEGSVFVFRDVTAEHELQRELLKVHKLESIGVLAGGLAHDFNQLLTVILSNMSLARSEVVPEHPIVSAIDAVERACVQGKALTGQLITFARGGALVKKPTPLGPLLQDTAEFVLRGSRVQTELEVPPDLWQRTSLRQPARQRAGRDAEGRAAEDLGVERRAR